MYISCMYEMFIFIQELHIVSCVYQLYNGCVSISGVYLSCIYHHTLNCCYILNMSCVLWVVCYELYIRVCIYIRRPAGNAPIHPQGHTRIIRGLYDGSQNSILTKLLTEFLQNCSHNFYQIINTIIDQIINTIVIHTIYYSSQMSCKCILWNFEFVVTTPKCVCIYRLKWTKAKKWMGWDGNLCEHIF